jgi:hypothetical protein
VQEAEKFMLKIINGNLLDSDCQIHCASMQLSFTARRRAGKRYFQDLYGIGCGLAGGDWNEYEILLEGFAARVSEMGVSVTLYRLDS